MMGVSGVLLPSVHSNICFKRTSNQIHKLYDSLIPFSNRFFPFVSPLPILNGYVGGFYLYLRSETNLYVGLQSHCTVEIHNLLIYVNISVHEFYIMINVYIVISFFWEKVINHPNETLIPEQPLNF